MATHTLNFPGANLNAKEVTLGDTASTSTTTGALTVVGGVGIVENLFVGGTGKIENITNATTTTSGALQVVGGLGVAKTVFAADMSSGSVDVTNNTPSTSTASGALQVTGGVGIVENLFVGGTGKIENITNATTTTSGALQVVGGLGVAKTVFAADMSSGSVDVTDTTISATTTTGALKVAGGIGVANNVHVGNDVYIGSNLNVDTNSLHVDSVSNRVGIGKTDPGFTLDVAGDINFSGELYKADALFVSTPWNIESTPTALSYTSGFVGIGEITPDATLHVTGNAYVTTNVHASNVYTQGGLITNRAGTCKKTYSHNGTLPTNATIANGTFTVNFSNHVFQAKIYATICEGTLTVSSINMDCVGGHITGGTPAAITLGEVVVVGHNSCPWSAEVTTTANAITFKIDHAVVGDGNYDIFVEYLSSHADGRVVKFTEGGADEITFNY